MAVPFRYPGTRLVMVCPVCHNHTIHLQTPTCNSCGGEMASRQIGQEAIDALKLLHKAYLANERARVEANH